MNAPTLLSSCAKAATAEEARYRIDYPNSRARSSRIVALDDKAAAIMRRVEDDVWGDAHFLTFRVRHSAPGIEALSIDATLATPDGAETRLSDELVDADVVVMIASSGEGIDAAAAVGNACFVRNIMTAGLIVSADRGDPDVERAVGALRPFAAVLVIASDEEYVPAMLHALRA
jgi:hypothetical protein